MIRKTISFLLLIIFSIGLVSAVTTNTTVLYDTFEGGSFANWTGNGITDWDLATDQSNSPTTSAHVGSSQNDLYSNNLDMSDATAFYISFYYRVDDIDNGDNIHLEYYDGSSYDNIDEIGDDAEDTWLRFSQRVTDSQYFISNFHIYIDGTSIDNNENLWIDDVLIIKEYDANAVPTMGNITADFSIIQGGDILTIYANTSRNGVNDSEADTLNLYCDTGDAPTAANTDCTGGTTSDTTYEYDLTCTFATPVTDASNIQYCRVYDGTSYSPTVNLSYTTDSTPPTISITSVAGDTAATYFDTVNDIGTDINISGEASMSCRWSASDLSYTAMTNDCTIGGTTASCNVTNALTQGLYTYYISCKDQYDNEHSSSTNTQVQFILDYTAPTTTDNSNTNIQAPPYSPVINENDNVDTDPTTLYCTDTTNSCTPNTAIDDLGTVTFTTSNRGTNYLRYFSTDDAGNAQSTASSTININQLPIFHSATDNATTIGPGSLVNITSYNFDDDPGQSVTMYVCDSTSANFEGCGGTEYCSATSTTNTTCEFSAQQGSGTYNWYAFVYDDSDEAATTNPKSGSYTVDADGPTITIISPQNTSYTQTGLTFSISLSETGKTAYYSINGSANVSMTNSSLTEFSRSVTLKDVYQHNVTFYANDSYGNWGASEITYFSVDTTSGDTTAPTITVQEPDNGTYYTTASRLLNITTDENLGWAGYSINGSATVTLGNTSMTSWNATVSFAEGKNTIVFYANDTSSNENQGTKTTIIYTDLTNASVTAFSCNASVADSQNTTCSASISDTLGLDYVIISHNASGSFVNVSTQSVSGTSDSWSYIIQSGNYTPGAYNVTTYTYDLSGRKTVNKTRITVTDNTNPSIANVVYTPNSADSLDPGTQIDINATITEDYNISIVYLMYKNDTSSGWNFLEMGNNSIITIKGNSSNIYNASFIPQTANWTFRINATDSAGNEQVSSNITVTVANETSANVTNALDSITSVTYAQRKSNNSLGIISLNNSGDTTLNFNVSISAGDLDSRFEVNYSGSITQNYTVTRNGVTNVTIDVNTTSLTAGLYDYTVTVHSAAGTTTYERKLNIQTAEGPYLSTTIETYSASVTSGQEGIQLVARVQNLGTQAATGVYLNWTLPSDFTLSTGTLNRSLGTILVGSSGTNTITIDVSSGAADANVSINANATATNTNYSNHTRIVTIGTPIVVTESGPRVSGGGGGSSSGGGGGGAGSPYDQIVELLRGKKGSFELEVENTARGTRLENLTLSITGFPEQYLSINPGTITNVGYGSKQPFEVIVDVPTYSEYEEYTLTAIVRGYMVSSTGKISPYRLTKKIKLVIQEIAEEQAVAELEEASNAINQMKQEGFNTKRAEELLSQAQKRFAEGKNKEAERLSQEIIALKDIAFKTRDLIEKISSVLKKPTKKSILLGNAIINIGKEKESSSLIDDLAIQELLELAKVAFERGDYELANERAEEARSLLLLNLKGNFGLFLLLYWHFILLGMILFSGLGIVGYRKGKKGNLTRRIRLINEEEENIKKIVSNIQKDYFKGKLDQDEYKRSLEQNQKKLANLREERIKIRNQKIEVLENRQIKKELEKEVQEIESEIKIIQTKYYIKHTISKDMFDFEYEVLERRLAEIESTRTTIDLLNQKKKTKKSVKKIEKKIKKPSRLAELKNKRHHIIRSVKKKIKNQKSKSSKKLSNTTKQKDSHGRWIKINIK